MCWRRCVENFLCPVSLVVSQRRRHALRVRYGRCVFLCLGGEVGLRALEHVPVLTSSNRPWLRGCCRCSGRVRGGWWSTSGRGC